ncbi:MAG: nitrate- and nitrite sensing domain-containing protein, partial [Frankia sp.]|nr:nitrate- and nitrite sensing domain-containing protein [Frankia sp.]
MVPSEGHPGPLPGQAGASGSGRPAERLQYVRRQPMASSTGIADPVPMPAPGTPVMDSGEDGESPAAPRPDGADDVRPRRGLFTNPAGWRVRTKLFAILAIPGIAILFNAIGEGVSLFNSTRDINRVSNLTEINQAGMDLIYALQRERTFTVDYIAAGQNPNARPDIEIVKTRRGEVDQAYQAFREVADDHRGSFGPAVDAALETVSLQMDNLSTKRQAVERMKLPVSAMEAYNAAIDPLINLVALIPQGNDDQELVDAVNATDHLVRSFDLLAQAQARATSSFASGQPFTEDDFRTLLSLYSERDSQLGDFEAAATTEQRTLYNSVIDLRRNLDVINAEKYFESLLDAEVDQPLEANSFTFDRTKWLQSTGTTIERGFDVIDEMFGMIDDRVGELRGDIQRDALFSALFTAAILAAALLIALVVAQSLVRPLFTLRTAALDIADRRLPEAVRRLRDSSEQVIDNEIETVGIDTDEEIGEVARAFDAVHREAVRLASEQAILRNNVNAMFVNLSRRSQGLVERQLRLIDDLENREQDPDQLANLFKLDHLATRMRRNNESLLVLAGTDTARRWTHPVPLNEVVLAAISEVEQYTRVKQTTAAPVSIAGNGVSDVVHLIAELLENATSYSPPATDVIVTSHSLGPGAGAIIEIVDQGIGMPAKDLERVNERLANPPVIDVSVSRTMGLFAVGRLAQRHGIRVQLRESPTKGITAVVRLPAKLVTGDSGASGPAAAARAGLGRPNVELPRQLGHQQQGMGGQQQGRPELLSSGAEGRRPGQRPDPEQRRDADRERFGPPSGPLPSFDGGNRFGTAPLALNPGTGGPGERRDERDAHPMTGPMTGPMPVRQPERYTEQDTTRIGQSPFAARDAATGPRSFDRSGEREQRDQREQLGPQTGGFPIGGHQPPAEQRQDSWTGEFQRPGVPDDGRADRGHQPAAAEHNGYPPPRQEQDTGPGSVFARPPTRPEPEEVPTPPWAGQEFQPLANGYHQAPEDTGGIYLDRDSEELDTTPIFDSVSAWFQRRTPVGEQPRVSRDPVVERAPSGAYSGPHTAATSRPMGGVTGSVTGDHQIQRPTPTPTPA